MPFIALPAFVGAPVLTIIAGNQRTRQTFMGGSTVDYSYDPIGQLRVANSSVNSEDRGYKYDSAWNVNWVTNNGSARQFSVDNKNQLSNVWVSYGGGPNLGYDLNGNLTWESSSACFTRNYDTENRLVQAWYGCASGGAPPPTYTQFAYDGMGRLRKKQTYNWDFINHVFVLQSETRYIYDGMRVIQERDSGNNPTVSYTRGSDLSGTMEGAGGIGGMLARSTGYGLGWNSHAYYHADGNGNITYMLDANQSKAASYKYDAFGNTISSSGSLASVNVYRFSSKQNMGVTDIFGSDLYYYGYRFYEPALQRWLNRDPLGEDGGINVYAFAANRSVGAIDPFGLAIVPNFPGQGYPQGGGPGGPLCAAALAAVAAANAAYADDPTPQTDSARQWALAWASYICSGPRPPAPPAGPPQSPPILCPVPPRLPPLDPNSKPSFCARHPVICTLPLVMQPVLRVMGMGPASNGAIVTVGGAAIIVGSGGTASVLIGAGAAL